MFTNLIKAISMPAIMAGLLLIWKLLVFQNFIFFWGIIAYFIIGVILSLLLHKLVGYKFYPFLILFLIGSLFISLLITPSPFATYSNWTSLNKSADPVSVEELSTVKYDRVNLENAAFYEEAKSLERFSAKGEYNGGRGIVPVINNNFNNSDTVYVYAAYSNYIGDPWVNGGFILDKDDEDYDQCWKGNVYTARIVKDTSKINVFKKLMEDSNKKGNLTPSNNVVFIEANYPHEEFAYITKKISGLGFILLAFAAVIHVMAVFKE